ncbi:MAG: bifunctional phosphopantothenoylcysteine decarboxylase/phosphopantothenate--cysteine ligase CoaBC [Balneolaceae bacterium]
MLSGKRIILGVTGGIAAYKTVFLLRELQKEGAEVRVTMTRAATRFVGIETFSSLSRNEVAVDIFNDNTDSENWTKHIHWGEWADLLVIAPCTANTLAKLVHGQADNMLTSTVLAARCPILLCPTMDGEMYDHPSVQKNLELARTYGYNILEPETGYLASGLEGKGRLPESGVIYQKIVSILSGKPEKGKLSGKHVVVTAGPTREFLDPVRYISNPSSGKMGIAMAEAAHQLGASVTLLYGTVSEPVPDYLHSESFTSASELFALIQKYHSADVFIMAAAVSDFSPAVTSKSKIKKEQAESSIKLKPNPDCLQWLGENRKEGQILIGFAMETENLEENALRKLKKKNADWILANNLLERNAGFETQTNHLLLVGKEKKREFTGKKAAIARQILEFIF